MKLLSYGLDHRMEPRLAFSLKGHAIDVMRSSLWMKEDRNAQNFLNLASSMKLALEDWDHSFSLLKELEGAFQTIDFEKLNIYDRPISMPESDIVFFSPISNAASMRCFHAFDNTLDFSFGNTQTLLGHKQALAVERLRPVGEMAAVIGFKKGGAVQSIAGYSIINNWVDTAANSHSGNYQGKATSIGPYLITADELETHKMGTGFNLDMHISVNGQLEKESRFKAMSPGFDEMILEAAPTRIQPGDIFCSGSPLGVEDFPPVKSGDVVNIEIQGLGVLSTPVGQGATPSKYR